MGDRLWEFICMKKKDENFERIKKKKGGSEEESGELDDWFRLNID